MVHQLNPNICKEVFGLERMSEATAVGPSDKGAAMVMGHSVSSGMTGMT